MLFGEAVMAIGGIRRCIGEGKPDSQNMGGDGLR